MASTMRFDTWENSTSNKSVTIDQIAGGSGLVPVVPTSVVVGSGTGTVAVNGLVTFSGASSISLNNCFSSAYKVYRAVMTFNASAYTSTQLRTRRAGTDNSTNGTYMWTLSETNATGTTPSIWSNNGDSKHTFGVARNTAQTSASFDIYNPYVSGIETTILSASFGPDSSSGFYQEVGGGRYTGTTQEDGITLLGGGQTFTGTIQVYGYR